MSIKSNF